MTRGYYQLPGGRVAAIEGNCAFPPLAHALTDPNGLLAIGGDLSVSRLLTAYAQGIFPWYNAGEPILWWSPDPRMVLIPSELNISRSLKKTLKNTHYTCRINTAFREVIIACSQARRAHQQGTWINAEMTAAYCELHRLGHAISGECWHNGQLIGGCYGVIIGRMFYGESMFHVQTDASKIAFVYLVNYLQTRGVDMIDCQMETPLLKHFGARPIARSLFQQQLTQRINP